MNKQSVDRTIPPILKRFANDLSMLQHAFDMTLGCLEVEEPEVPKLWII